MSVLVLAEHNNKEIKASTYNSISAASEIDSNIEVLVIGSNCEELSNQLCKAEKINKVLLIE